MKAGKPSGDADTASLPSTGHPNAASPPAGLGAKSRWEERTRHENFASLTAGTPDGSFHSQPLSAPRIVNEG